MSRIGRKPVTLPQGVTAQIDGHKITVKGPKGEISRTLHEDMALALEDGTVTVKRPSDEAQHKALHGLTRTLVANMVEGVTTGSPSPSRSRASAIRPSPSPSACSWWWDSRIRPLPRAPGDQDHGDE